MPAEDEWPPEDIPDNDELYLRAFYRHFSESQPTPSCFVPHGDAGQEKGLSTDWKKYRTAAQTRASSLRKGPEQYGVVSLVAGRVRGLGLTVEHTPDRANKNRAHTDVWGLDPDYLPEDSAIDVTELRLWMLEIAIVEIAPGSPIN